MLDGVSDSQPSTGSAGTAGGVFAGVRPARSLWPHQERAVRAYNADQATGDRSTYLVVPPGGGKSVPRTGNIASGKIVFEVHNAGDLIAKI